MSRTTRAIYDTTLMIACCWMPLSISLLTVLTVMPVQGEEVFFDDFRQFTSGTVLTTTNYIPVSSPLGSSAKFQFNAGSSQVIATNFQGGIWVYADEKIGGNNKFQGTFPFRLNNKVVDISWTMLTQGTNSGTGGFFVNILVSANTNGDVMYNPLLFLTDNGQVCVSTNNPPSLPLLTVGNWGQYVGTVMTNRLKLNYLEGFFTFSINGSTVTNMPIPSCFTNVLDAVRLQFFEAFPDSLGNRFLLDDVRAVVQDYIYTNNGDGTCFITEYIGLGGAVAITNMIDGLLVTSIGNTAFSFCDNLSNVMIPDSVTNIGDYAFYFCGGLTNIMIPKSVASIGISAFSCCSSLTEITVDPLNSFYSSTNGVLFNKNQTTLIGYPGGGGGGYTIPFGVAIIGYDAFDLCFNLTNVFIPNSVTNIGEYAFSGCTNLASVVIPNSVISIGNDAFLPFFGSTSLTGIYCKGNAPRIGSTVAGGSSSAIVYYFPWTSGWTNTFGGQPTQVNPTYSQWLTNNGFTTNLTDDDDKDGMFNWQEYLAGTSPTNDADRLAIASMGSGTNAQITWQAKSNVSYQVGKSLDLTGTWLNAPSGTGASQQAFQTAPADGLLLYADPAYAGATNGFYRVSVR